MWKRKKPTLNVLGARHRLAPIEGQKENKKVVREGWKKNVERPP
jgi:hypothetical protein